MTAAPAPALFDYSKGTVKVYLPGGEQSPRFNDPRAAFAWWAGRVATPLPLHERT